MPDLFPGVTMYIFYEGGGGKIPTLGNTLFLIERRKNGGFKSLFPLEPSLYSFC